jgi:hypothetical protein
MTNPNLEMIFTPQVWINDDKMWQAVITISASVVWGDQRTIIGEAQCVYPELFSVNEDAYKFAEQCANWLRG